jgi:hypothetical protein
MVVSLLGLTGSVYAANTFTDAGADHLWNNPDNWSMGVVPQDATTHSAGAIPKWNNDVYMTTDNTLCVIDDSHVGSNAATAYGTLVGAHGGDNTLHILDGELRCGGWGFNVGRGGKRDSDEGSFGHVLMTEGKVSTPWFQVPEQHLGDNAITSGAGQDTWIQRGQLVMTGGTITTGWFHIGETVSIGHVDLYGGTIHSLGYFLMGPDGSLNITEGVLKVDGNRVDVIQGYIDNGWITAHGGFGTLELDFNVTNAGMTTLKASATEYRLVDKASVPYPTDGAVDVALDTNLFWGADPTVTQHFVYLLATPVEPDAAPEYALSRVVLAANVVKGRGAFAPVELEYDTTYLWAVDLGVDGSQPYDPNTIKGDTWTFTTIPDPNVVDWNSVD